MNKKERSRAMREANRLVSPHGEIWHDGAGFVYEELPGRSKRIGKTWRDVNEWLTWFVGDSDNPIRVQDAIV